MILVALQSLHQKNFIHRDLKLDNVMFLEKAYDSPIKIIDLGNIIELDSPDGVFKDDYLVGTPGNVQCLLWTNSFEYI
jgi:serine/threonine protein kinase